MATIGCAPPVIWTHDIHTGSLNGFLPNVRVKETTYLPLLVSRFGPYLKVADHQHPPQILDKLLGFDLFDQLCRVRRIKFPFRLGHTIPDFSRQTACYYEERLWTMEGTRRDYIILSGKGTHTDTMK